MASQRAALGESGGQGLELSADFETTAMARLRREVHARMLGNGLCTRPVELDEPVTPRTCGPGRAAVERVLRDRHLHVLEGSSAAHFHAFYGEFEALVRIDDGSLLRGDLPRTARRLLSEWMETHRDDLMANWRRAQVPEALVPIEPLR